MPLSSRIVFSTSITEGEGKAHAFWTHIGRSINNVMMELPVMLGYERHDLFDDHGRRLPTTTRKNSGARELPSSHTGAPITVSWPIDNGRSTVTRTFRPPFTPVNREEDYRVAYEVFSQRLGIQGEMK